MPPDATPQTPIACPYCGSTNVGREIDRQRYIECMACGAFGPSEDSEQSCKRWNRRAAIDIPEEQE